MLVQFTKCFLLCEKLNKEVRSLGKQISGIWLNDDALNTQTYIIRKKTSKPRTKNLMEKMMIRMSEWYLTKRVLILFLKILCCQKKLE